jgi:hypothetical protein
MAPNRPMSDRRLFEAGSFDEVWIENTDEQSLHMMTSFLFVVIFF